MQRYTLTHEDDASPAVRAVYDDFLRTTGSTSVPIWLKALGHSESLARAYWERAKGTLFGGVLPLALKEMIVFTVSATHGARYCSACHAQNVLSLDQSVTFEDLQAFVGHGTSATLPPYYATVVDFATKVALDANSVTDADVEDLQDDGFGLAEIGEIVAVIDMATMFNVFTSALNLDLDPEYRAVL
ncbi:MAG TPA: carboxymuconolactone decarboxylase family protein [Actinotalea sp.]|nr:carboxymuconolactone decarboxylase family protein [Actinotalea sp.]